MKALKHWGLAAIVALGTIQTTTAQEDYAMWSGHENIIVNTKASGANLTAGIVTQYPLLVRLDSANASAIFTAAQAGGVDIRFGKVSGARLPFERERWDATARKAEFWVLMDTVRANDSGTALRIHWGRAGAADSSRSRSVFTAANGFIAVWHMNQTVTAAGDSLVDATGNGHRGTVALEGVAPVPANMTTGIGIGKNFTGDFTAGTTITTGAYFLVSNADSALNLNTNTGPFTISAWARPELCDATARMGLFTKYGNVNTGPTGARAYALQTANVDGNWRLTMDPLAFADTGATAVTTEYVSDVPCTPLEWTYLSAGYNSLGVPPTPDEAGALNIKMSRYGGSMDFTTGTGFTATQQPRSVGKAANVYIGRIHNVDRFFRGGIDELRVSNVQRSANWEKLDYEIQKSGSRTVFVGFVPPIAVQPGSQSLARGFSVSSSGSSVVFRVPEGLSDAEVYILDLSGREVWSRALRAGTRSVVWNGISTSGGRTTPGSYIARIKTAQVATKSKVVLLR